MNFIEWYKSNNLTLPFANIYPDFICRSLNRNPTRTYQSLDKILTTDALVLDGQDSGIDILFIKNESRAPWVYGNVPLNVEN